MKPLFHPDLAAITVEGLLHALSDPLRVAIYAGVASAGCASPCTAFQHIAAVPIPKSSLSQHFKVLRDAGLIRSERHGVELRNTTRCAEIETRFPGVLPAILDAYRRQASGR